MCTAVLAGFVGFAIVALGMSVGRILRGISSELDELDGQIEQLIAVEHRDELPFRLTHKEG